METTHLHQLHQSHPAKSHPLRLSPVFFGHLGCSASLGKREKRFFNLVWDTGLLFCCGPPICSRPPDDCASVHLCICASIERSSSIPFSSIVLFSTRRPPRLATLDCRPADELFSSIRPTTPTSSLLDFTSPPSPCSLHKWPAGRCPCRPGWLPRPLPLLLPPPPHTPRPHPP